MKNFNSFFNQLSAMPKRLAATIISSLVSYKRYYLLLTILFTLGVGQILGTTPTVNSILWQESFTNTTTSGSTSFSASSADAISAVANSQKGTTMFSTSDITSLKYTANNVMLTATSGTNCTGAHIWLNKQTTAYFQVEEIPLYGATKVCIMWNQGGSSSVTAHYKLDDGNWTSIKSTSSAGEDITSLDINTANKTKISVKFVRTSTNTNVRLDDLRVKVTEVAASCDKKVTISKGSETNGTFTLDNSGEQETCDGDLVITLSNITPSAGYQFGEITQSGINTGVTIDQENKKVTYAQNTSGTSTINVTFNALPTHTVTWKVNGTEYNAGSPTTQVYDGGKVTTLPTAPDPANYCGQVFAGWTTTPIDGEVDTEPSVLFTTAANSPEITGNITFYAVFADYAN